MMLQNDNSSNFVNMRANNRIKLICDLLNISNFEIIASTARKKLLIIKKALAISEKEKNDLMLFGYWRRNFPVTHRAPK